MDNRFYLQALGITGLFILLMVLFWIASGGPASEAAIQNANSTRTAIAMTGSYLLQPPTRTPPPFLITPTLLPGITSTIPVQPSVTSTSLLSQLNTPIVLSPASTSLLPQLNTPISPSLAALPTQTTAPIPIFTITAPPRRANTKAPALSAQSATPTVVQVSPQSATPSLVQDPAEFARWYFTRVWNERDYQNLWDNYLTPSYKANVGSGLFEDYVWWWNSVARVDVQAVEVLENNGSASSVRVHLNFYMSDGRVVENQIYDYDFLYDPGRNTWMFDFR